jgi:hypothetical protein
MGLNFNHRVHRLMVSKADTGCNPGSDSDRRDSSRYGTAEMEGLSAGQETDSAERPEE